MTLLRIGGRFPHFLAFCLVMCVVTSGCGPAGPPRVQISGAVTLDGAPLDSGSISFIPEQGVVGPMAGGEIKSDGTYLIPTASGPTTGSHRVEIKSWSETGEKKVAGVDGSATGPSGGGSVATTKMIIPAKYNSQSELKVEIKPGENKHDFTLESKP